MIDKNKEERLVVLLDNVISLYMEETVGIYDNLEDWYKTFYEEIGSTEEELNSYGIDMEI